MRTILSIFALSMFLSCQEDTSSGFRRCGRMTLSDALPVQFWLSECDTFNQHEAGGVHHVCWCQPWNCDDEIVVQFQETTGGDFILLVKDVNGAILKSTSFSEVSSEVYQTSVRLIDDNLCDQDVQLAIISSGSELTFSAPTLWTDPFNDFPTKTSTFFQRSQTPGDGLKSADVALQVPNGTNIGFSYEVTVSGTWASVNSTPLIVSFNLLNASDTPSSTGLLTTIEKTISANGTYNYNEVLTATDAIEKLQITLNEQLTSGTAVVRITVPTGQVLYITDDQVVAKSDCLEIAESHDETIFIEYSNNKNYAGLVYEDNSPDVTFGIRVPCRFFHEIEPEEDEAMELTSSVIITSAQVKTQRLLEVKHAPYYFHKKLRRILKHQTITIFDKQWKKEEKYEVIEGKKTWPLKAATCLLTEKDSVVRNVS